MMFIGPLSGAAIEALPRAFNLQKPVFVKLFGPAPASKPAYLVTVSLRMFLDRICLVRFQPFLQLSERCTVDGGKVCRGR